MTSTLQKLQQWYFSQCDGDWEHGEGIRVSTLDNPGWMVDISLREAELEDRKYDEVRIDRSEQDWLRCSIRDGKFFIACGPKNLEEGLSIFLEWVAPDA